MAKTVTMVWIPARAGATREIGRAGEPCNSELDEADHGVGDRFADELLGAAAGYVLA